MLVGGISSSSLPMLSAHSTSAWELSYHVCPVYSRPVMEEMHPSIDHTVSDGRSLRSLAPSLSSMYGVEVLEACQLCTSIQNWTEGSSTLDKSSRSYTDQGSYSCVALFAWKPWKTTFPAGSAMLACWCHGEISID